MFSFDAVQQNAQALKAKKIFWLQNLNSVFYRLAKLIKENLESSAETFINQRIVKQIMSKFDRYNVPI